MLSFAEREARLTAFIADLLPDHRVIASSKVHRAAVEEGLSRLPEVRVILARTNDNILRWDLRIAEDNLTPDTIPGTVQTLCAALQQGDTPATWRLRDGRRDAEHDARIWIQTVEEAWTPNVYISQVAFANASECAEVANTVPPGTKDFGTLSFPEDTPQVSDGTFIIDSQGAEYLGLVLAATPNLTTELGTSRSFESGAQIWRLAESAQSGEAGMERDRHDYTDTRLLATSLTGIRQVRVTGSHQYQQEIEWPLISEQHIYEWLDLFDRYYERASVLLILRDRRMLEAAFTELETDRDEGRLRIRFQVQTPTNFAVFREPES